VERHRLVHDLLAQNLTLTQIQRRTGWDAKTVRRYADADDPSQLMAGCLGQVCWMSTSPS
jgi:hypothetical protein